jgi:hypothetical protein
MRTDGRTDGWTGVTKLIVAFSNFVSAPKTITIIRLNAILEHSYITGMFPHSCSHSNRFRMILWERHGGKDKNCHWRLIS